MLKRALNGTQLVYRRSRRGLYLGGEYPQIVTTIKKKKATDVSPVMFAVLLTGNAPDTKSRYMAADLILYAKVTLEDAFGIFSPDTGALVAHAYRYRVPGNLTADTY